MTRFIRGVTYCDRYSEDWETPTGCFMIWMLEITPSEVPLSIIL